MTEIVTVFKFVNHLGDFLLQENDADAISMIFKKSNFPLLIGKILELKIDDNVANYEIIDIHLYPYFRFSTTEEYIKNTVDLVNNEILIYIKPV